MSPRKLVLNPPERVELMRAQVAASLGREVRQERTRRGWSLERLAERAHMSPAAVRSIETGAASSLDGYTRVALALGLEPRFTILPEPRTGTPWDADPVHAAMGEAEAGHFRELGYEVLVDEPYQHYKFAGRADVVVVDRERRAMLHNENRTRFPDIQSFAGTWNAKRAYLADDLAKRLGIRGGWRSVSHAVVALWSSEALHALRLREQTFRSTCPDDAAAFAAWWAGSPPERGTFATLVVFDPLPGQRTSRRRWIGLDDSRVADPRYLGYAQALKALRLAGVA